MSKKIRVMLHITTIVIALSVAAIAFILMPVCEYCGSKFCFNTCDQTGGIIGGVNTSSGKRENSPETNQNTTRLVETPVVDSDYLDSIAFIGDSRTVALQFFDISESQIFAENSLTHQQALTKNIVRLSDEKYATIEEAVKVTAPEILLINFGINGAAWMPDEEFITTYEEFIDQMLSASPSSIIVIESILPVSVDYENRSDGIKNERIDELNELLYELAKDKGLYYMATNEALKGDNNALDPAYNSDGLHYNEAAYDVILNYVKNHAVYKK